MKKLIYAGIVSLLLLSCTKNSEQIEVVKTKLKSWNTSEKDLEAYTFVTSEVSDKEMYNLISKNYHESYIKYKDTDLGMAAEYLKSEGKYVEMMGKASNKTFYVVKATALVAGDTLHKKTFYIDDKNQIVDVDNIK